MPLAYGRSGVTVKIEDALTTIGVLALQGDFIEHYLLPTLYPAGFTRGLQIWLGIGALVPNVLFYAYLFLRKRRAAPRHEPH